MVAGLKFYSDYDPANPATEEVTGGSIISAKAVVYEDSKGDKYILKVDGSNIVSINDITHANFFSADVILFSQGNGSNTETAITKTFVEATNLLVKVMADVEAAETAKTAAESARTGAESARDDAVLAKTGAGNAQTAAESARTGAESARDAAIDAQQAAEAARDDALSSSIFQNEDMLGKYSPDQFLG